MKTEKRRRIKASFSSAEKESRRRAIAAAALSVFRNKGFAQTRVEDISSEADVAKGTFYLYFPSRNAILEYLFEQFFVQTFSIQDEAVQVDDYPAFIIKTIGDLFDRAAGNLDIVPLFWEVSGHEAVQAECSLNMKISGLFDGLSKMIGSLLQQAKDAGQLEPGLDITAFSRMLISCIDGMMLHAAIFGKHGGVDQKQQKKAFMRAMRKALTPEKSF